jgi:hypothetical protein
MASELRALNAADAEPTVLSLLYEPGDIPEGDTGSADFANFVQGYGVREARWAVARTGIAHTLRKLGAWHDLAVIERDIGGMGDPESQVEVLGEALLACRMPCLVVPSEGEITSTFERIAIGWNGSAEATHAICAALPLLVAANEVCIFDGSFASEDSDDGLPPFDPIGYLAQQGVAASVKKIHTDTQSDGAALLEMARVMGAHLLVMGAYSHSRLRERVLGGATRYVLGHATLPVLLQH